MSGLDWAITVLLSAAPVFELRGGLPYAVARGADPHLALAVAVFANLAVIPAAVFGLVALRPYVADVKIIGSVLGWLDRRARRRSAVVERLGLLGLVLFVAVPLPGTGAWTAAFVAVAAGLRPRNAAPAIALGVVIAGTLVYLASVGVMTLFE